MGAPKKYDERFQTQICFEKRNHLRILELINKGVYKSQSEFYNKAITEKLEKHEQDYRRVQSKKD